MTDSSGAEDRPPHRLTARALLRALASTVVLVALYYTLPFDHGSAVRAVVILGIGLATLVALVAFQVRSIVRSRYPGLRAVEALATSVPLFLLLYAATYVAISAAHADSFSESLTRTDSLYFTITVFATVGFGDITATTEGARLVVTGQMLADLVVLGLGVRVIVSAVSRGRQRKPADTVEHAE
jgi:Ion channel